VKVNPVSRSARTQTWVAQRKSTADDADIVTNVYFESVFCDDQFLSRHSIVVVFCCFISCNFLVPLAMRDITVDKHKIAWHCISYVQSMTSCSQVAYRGGYFGEINPTDNSNVPDFTGVKQAGRGADHPPL
jgi:hypothetical protein